MKFNKQIKILILLGLISCSSSTNFRDSCCSPSNVANTYYSQGIAKRKAGEINTAIELYQKALNVSPLFTCARVNLAILYHETKRFDEALSEFSIAKSQQPKDSVLRRSIGDVYRDLGQLDKAESEYKSSIELDPNNANSHYKLAGIYSKKKSYDLANLNYEKFLSLEKSKLYPKQVDYSKKYIAWYSSRKTLKTIEDNEKLFSSIMKPKIDFEQCNENFSLAFVVDKSGSVRDSQVIETIKSSLTNVIPKLKPSIKLSIVAFDFAPFVVSKNLTMNKQGKETVINRIKILFGNGRTIILPALHLAKNMLDNSDNTCRALIIVSDGFFENPGEFVKELFKEDKNFHLTAVQLGKGSPYPEMFNIARAGNGTYYLVPKLESTTEILEEILEALKLIQ